MGQDDVATLNLDAEPGVGQGFDHGALEGDCFFFRQMCFRRNKRRADGEKSRMLPTERKPGVKFAPNG